METGLQLMNQVQGGSLALHQASVAQLRRIAGSLKLRTSRNGKYLTRSELILEITRERPDLG